MWLQITKQPYLLFLLLFVFRHDPGPFLVQKIGLSRWWLLERILKCGFVQESYTKISRCQLWIKQWIANSRTYRLNHQKMQAHKFMKGECHFALKKLQFHALKHNEKKKKNTTLAYCSNSLQVQQLNIYKILGYHSKGFCCMYLHFQTITSSPPKALFF